jgi:hypothetical protein
LIRSAAGIGAVYASWIGMLAVHELGHMINAWVSGGRVAKVIFPVLGFSQTIVWPNPHERFVVWGGPVWGALIPVTILGATYLIRRRVPAPLTFFAGFCLIANGVYIGVGWMTHSGDAGDLRRLGTPVPLMIASGAIAFAGGLYLWHRVRWPWQVAGRETSEAQSPIIPP